MIDDMSPPDTPVHEFGNRKFTLLMASDVIRDGVGLELRDAVTDELVAEVFYSDADGGMTA